MGAAASAEYKSVEEALKAGVSQTDIDNYLLKKELSGKISLTYFGEEGRAFMIRSALHYAGIEFEDIRISIPDYIAAKKAGKYPNGLPILTLPSGESFNQGFAILRYIGKIAGLYPTDPRDSLAVDVVLGSVFDIFAKSPGHKDEAEKKKLREAYAAGSLKATCGVIENLLKRAKSGPAAIGGDKITIADLGLHFFTNNITTGNFDYVPKDYLDKFPRITEVHKFVESHPIAQNWRKFRDSKKETSAAKEE